MAAASALIRSSMRKDAGSKCRRRERFSTANLSAPCRKGKTCTAAD